LPQDAISNDFSASNQDNLKGAVMINIENDPQIEKSHQNLNEK